MMGYPGLPLRHPDLYAMDLLASILGDGRSSRLYREVKDKGLVTEISAVLAGRHGGHLRDRAEAIHLTRRVA